MKLTCVSLLILLVVIMECKSQRTQYESIEHWYYDDKPLLDSLILTKRSKGQNKFLIVYINAHYFKELKEKFNNESQDNILTFFITERKDELTARLIAYDCIYSRIIIDREFFNFKQIESLSYQKKEFCYEYLLPVCIPDGDFGVIILNDRNSSFFDCYLTKDIQLWCQEKHTLEKRIEAARKIVVYLVDHSDLFLKERNYSRPNPYTVNIEETMIENYSK